MCKIKGHLVRGPMPGDIDQLGGLGLLPCDILTPFLDSGEFFCTNLCFLCISFKVICYMNVKEANK